MYDCAESLKLLLDHGADVTFFLKIDFFRTKFWILMEAVRL